MRAVTLRLEPQDPCAARALAGLLCLSLPWAPGLKFPLEIGGPALSVRAGYDAKRF
jgi:hypothetical protein